MSEFIIDIPNWTPTPLNKLLGHWAGSARKKKSDARMIWAYAASAQIPKAQGRRSVEITITLEKRQRACDPDAYFKSTNDALVLCGLLIDDNRQGVELSPIRYKRGSQKATRIVLRDIA